MQFIRFRIRNYKGIQDCTIDVDRPNPRVFSLIGLNESGKTTILEAINYFVASDTDLQRMYNIEPATTNKADFVPKSKKSNFNGDITVSADLRFDQADVDALAAALLKDGYILDRKSVPKSLTVKQYFTYENSNFVKQGRTWGLGPAVTKKGAKSLKVISASHPCWQTYHQVLLSRIPQICYFPTFLFELPDRIYLEPYADEPPVNGYYRRLLQDILDSLNDGLTIETHIIKRIRGDEVGWSWFSFLQTDQREQVNHVLLRASAKATKVIMESWQRVFNRSFDSKRIEIEYGHDASKDAIYVKMYLVDGAEKYDIGDRSLGFRWFFCFWLFTYFRTLRSNVLGTVFLLDEPASNLHARAQEELLSNIEGLASGANTVIYSTHSHYLVSPKWLDSAYIVANGALTYTGVEDEFLGGSETNITATTYRRFVGKHPNQRTYFLPVLDALDYKPSELAIERPALLVEGKTDFAFLKVAWRGADIGFSVVPGNGAKSLNPLISLMTGWAFPFAVLVDDDKEGRDASAMYEETWRLGDGQLRTLAAFNDSYSDKSLEAILLAELSQALKDHFATDKPEKTHVQTYLYEAMAADLPVELTPALTLLAGDIRSWATAVLNDASNVEG